MAKRIRDILQQDGKSLTPPRNWLGRHTGTSLVRAAGEAEAEAAEAAAQKRRGQMGGTVTNTLTGAQMHLVSLLAAMRSKAPGGWSDNRFEQARHFVGITYLAVRTLCEQAANAELKVFRKDPSTPEGKKQVTHDDELYQLLMNPNEEDTFAELMYQKVLQLSLTGMELLWTVPNGFGRPCQLFVIPTALAIPLPAAIPEYPNGAWRIQPLYPYGPFTTLPTNAATVGAVVPAEMIVRTKNPHPILRYDGYSTQTAIRQQADTIEAIDRGRQQAQLRGIDPSAVMEFDSEVENPTPEGIRAIHAEFEQLFMGPENVGRLLVAPPGVQVKPWSQSPHQMAWESGWEQMASFLLAAWGVTKPVAGMMQESSYSTLYAALKQFHLLTLCPLLKRIAGKLTKHLAPFFGDDYLIELEAPRIDDEEIIERMLANDLSARAMTKNEWRVKRGLPTTKEIWGETLVGDPTPQQAAPGMLTDQAGGAAAPAGPGAGLAGLLGGQTGEGAGANTGDANQREVEQSRPKGAGGQGALGARPKSYEGNGKDLTNGHVNGHVNGAANGHSTNGATAILPSRTPSLPPSPLKAIWARRKSVAMSAMSETSGGALRAPAATGKPLKRSDLLRTKEVGGGDPYDIDQMAMSLPTPQPQPTPAPPSKASSEVPAAGSGHDYASTQFDLPTPLAKKVLALGEDILARDLDEEGLETKPHITIKYGLHHDDPDAVRDAVRDFGPVTVTLGKTSCFTSENAGGKPTKADVLKIDIDGARIHQLHTAIKGALANTETYPEYKPHITIAYLKPGRGKKYADDDRLEGIRVTFTSFTFSPANGEPVSISLVGNDVSPTEPGPAPAASPHQMKDSDDLTDDSMDDTAMDGMKSLWEASLEDVDLGDLDEDGEELFGWLIKKWTLVRKGPRGGMLYRNEAGKERYFKTPPAGSEKKPKEEEKKEEAAPEDLAAEAKRAWSENDQEALGKVMEQVREQSVVRRGGLGVAGLRKLATAIGISGNSKMNKAALIAAVTEKLHSLKATSARQNLAERLDRIGLAEKWTGMSFVDRVVKDVIATSKYTRSDNADGQAFLSAWRDIMQYGDNAKRESFIHLRQITANVKADLLSGNVPDDKLRHALDGIATEGYGRLSPAEFKQFLDGTLHQAAADKTAEGVLGDLSDVKLETTRKKKEKEKPKAPEDYIDRLRLPKADRLEAITKRQEESGVTFLQRTLNKLVADQSLGIDGQDRYIALTNRAMHGSDEHGRPVRFSADEREFMTGFRGKVLQMLKLEPDKIGIPKVLNALESIDQEGHGTLSVAEFMRHCVQGVNVFTEKHKYA